MSIIKIRNSESKSSHKFLSAGFRPFFLVAGIFSLCLIANWGRIYLFKQELLNEHINIFEWHAHEMIYGYCLAVIAGFLLTAVSNWTGRPTLQNRKLFALLLLWLTARVILFTGDQLILYAACADLLFNLWLIIAIFKPIILSKQWNQFGVMLKVALLFLGNLFFYLGALEITSGSIFYSIYGGLLLVIGLILAIARRVLPFFIEKALGAGIKIYQPRWLDYSMMITFLLFSLSVLLKINHLNVIAALLLGILSIYRLYLWYQPGIWNKCLLWSLYISIIFIAAGFFLYFGAGLNYWEVNLAWHSFSYGGIGLVTLSMMSRVLLGHSGGDISQPPGSLRYSFYLLVLGWFVRVLFPIFSLSNYILWIAISQLFWIIAFAIFLISFRRILIPIQRSIVV